MALATPAYQTSQLGPNQWARAAAASLADMPTAELATRCCDQGALIPSQYPSQILPMVNLTQFSYERPEYAGDACQGIRSVERRAKAYAGHDWLTIRAGWGNIVG